MWEMLLLMTEQKPPVLLLLFQRGMKRNERLGKPSLMRGCLAQFQDAVQVQTQQQTWIMFFVVVDSGSCLFVLPLEMGITEAPTISAP